MKSELIENPEQGLVDFLDQKINEFNWQNWEVKEQKPIAIKITNERAEIIAGVAGRTFGDWFLLDTLWVSDNFRGNNLGSQLLNDIEVAVINRGCKKVLLDTLNFQAMPFYKQHGYSVEWTQQGYPRTGCKYFMVKALLNN
jgi:ribosomal protein S18 acetylase RimI-like enzyme